MTFRLKSAILFFWGSLVLFSCKTDNKPLDFNFKLKYKNEPLVMFNEYVYPDGRLMKISAFKFYISDIRINQGTSSQTIHEVDYLDFLESHSNSEKATGGYTITYDMEGFNSFNSISFNLGLTEAQNSTTPADHSSSDALARSGEYWPDWDSYIFIKIEGLLDFDSSGKIDNGENFVLHLGKNEIARIIESPDLTADDLVTIIIEVDKIFETADGEIYDIDQFSDLQTESIENFEQMNFLADNLKAATSFE